MGSWIYFVKALNDDGEEVILRLRFHHSNLEQQDEVTEEEMKQEIEDNKL